MNALGAVALAAIIVLAAVPVEAQQGRVATSYVRINVEPDFQYEEGRDVVIPVQVRAVRGGVPTQERVSLEIRTENGEQLSIPGGQAWLQSGVQPYPSVVWVNLGKQEVGLYRVIVHAEAGDLQRDWKTEYDVVHPPQDYEAALLGARGREGRFVFESHNPLHDMTITMYRGSPSAGHVIEEATTNKAVLDVPYIPGESVTIQVVDENGWKNAENKRVEWTTGRVYYDAWVWNPDYEQIENYQNQSWREAVVSGAILLAVVAAWFFMRRRTA